MLELFDALATLTWRIVIAGLAVMAGFVMIGCYRWLHHRDRLVREDLDGPRSPPPGPLSPA